MRQKEQLLVAPTDISQFVILTKGPLKFKDRTKIESGHVGTTNSSATWSIDIGHEARIAFGHLLMGRKIRTGDRVALGGVFVNTLQLGASPVVQAQDTYAAPPPLPEIEPFSAGTSNLTRGTSGSTVSVDEGTWAVGNFSKKILLTGGEYTFSTLNLAHDTVVTADAPVTIRITQKLIAGDRVKLRPDEDLGAEALRLIASGSASDAIKFGHDNTFTGLVLAPAGGMTTGDRFKGTGAFAAAGATVGGDNETEFEHGFGCSRDEDCVDGLLCTSDECTDGVCAFVPVEEGDTCGGGTCDDEGDCECLPDFEGDNCEQFQDADGDLVGDSTDNCVDADNQGQEDSDGDGLGNVCDNCPFTANAGQEDADDNDTGDLCDGYNRLRIEAGDTWIDRIDLSDSKTYALADTPNDLQNLDKDAPAEATLFAYTFEGQELAVFNYPFGVQPWDLGGAIGWPFLTGLKVSRVAVPVGESRTIAYDHGTSHVVRYVHGTCAIHAPLGALFADAQAKLEEQLIDQVLALDSPTSVMIQRCGFEAQPHFRGEVGLSQPNHGRLEMGIYFDARYRIFASFIVGLGGATIRMNPGFAFQPAADGSVDVTLINNLANVEATGLGASTIQDETTEALQAVPAELEDEFRKQLIVPLGDVAPELAFSCGSAAGCFADIHETLEDGCAIGDDLACAMNASVEESNFVCQSGECAFRPIVQGVNVTPTDIEFVLAPDPDDLSIPWSVVYAGINQRIIDAGGTPLCAPLPGPDAIIDGEVVTRQEGMDISDTQCESIDFQ